MSLPQVNSRRDGDTFAAVSALVPGEDTCKLVLSADLLIPSGVLTLIDNWTVEDDPLGAFNPATPSLVTVPEGYKSYFGNVAFKRPTSPTPGTVEHKMHFKLVAGGVNLGVTHRTAHSGNYPQFGDRWGIVFSSAILFTTGDQLTLSVQHDYGVDVYLDSRCTAMGFSSVTGDQ